ncbi:UDP-N-acetylmuramoyl-tripeptide--D-alanyl-D-alanine ligase [Methylomonas sp. DH-1]|uniref:UDP-N-acetylmuramoyl-tripeptide--D-alanyl-D- alanine ligase n=1 Tax=Methylomonas sp. (strain DH-1) TaxID=1727196 RepID=UPI0007C9CFA7|nr:UDP-N-acetylmuramoyl-tripeptide--D-alanyl-D-alanine ligase [Methylomonas sp. DH-1]ANE57222.1 UDP-N-acetylmuramoylalanyl-D-glutamate--2,6-diaminopimelate ligase [Methylomonas sp. DH-1]
MKMLLSEIAQAVNGTLAGADRSVESVSIDTRTLKPGELYLALKGKNFDGHSFIDKAEQAGAGALLLAHACASELPQIVVADTHLALAELAGYWRRQLPVKVAGVTGSNGKTTVKEMIAAIFTTQGPTLSTQGNLNNDIGVPLTLLKLDASHRYAVIEMGANHIGEIAYTSRYAQADVSVINNVGAAHIEGFGDLNGVAKTKGEIIESLGPESVAVLNRDDAFFDFWLALAGPRKSVSFGFHPAADVRAEQIETGLDADGFATRFQLQTGGESIDIRLNLAGAHNVKNALAAAAVALQFGIGRDAIKTGLEGLRPVVGRMQPLRGRHNNIVVDDTYNANPSSLRAALEAIAACGESEIWLALGAFGELGPDSPAIHREMGESVKAMGVKRLFATGELARHSVAGFGAGARYYDTQEQLIADLTAELSGRETLLVKGSRAQKMENVVAALVDNFRAA